MTKKKTTVDLLQEIATLLEPVSNLARFNIGNINAQMEAEKAKKEGKKITKKINNG